MSSWVQTTAQPDVSHEFSLQWYAVLTKARHERKIATQLQRSGIEHFLPIIFETKCWSDRWKKIEVPLFPCYLFVHMVASETNTSAVLQTSGVLHILGRGNQREAIPAEEIERVQRLVDSEAGISSHVFLQPKDKVRIRGGALDGVEGILEELGDEKRLVVSIQLLRQSVSVSLNGYEVERV